MEQIVKFAETDGLYKQVFRGKPVAGRNISSQGTSLCDQLPKDILGKVNFKLFSFESGNGFNRLHQNTNLGGTLAVQLKANADKFGHMFVWESCLSNTKNKNMIENWWKQENEMRVRWKWEAPPTWPVSRSSLKWDYLTPPTFPVIAGYGSCKWLVLCLVPLVRQGTRSPIMM